MGGIVPVIVVDLFTGKHLRMPTDYPGFAASYCGPAGTKQFGSASLVFDPLLELVVYPQMDSDPPNLVLWDIQARKALAKIEEDICFGNYPLWSPSGQRFIVANYLKDSKPTGEVIEEWASVSRAGQVEWLTSFVDYFAEVEIGGANWSPDGRRVAFWMRTKPDLCPNTKQDWVHLAVLEVDTHRVINYCVSGDAYSAPTPVWSLDGRYIAIRNYEEELSRIFLVDLAQGWAATIAGEDIWPVGWLQSPSDTTSTPQP